MEFSKTTGCWRRSFESSAPAIGRLLVVAQPSQEDTATVPDGAMPPGTKVRLVSEHGSYIQVESETAGTVYVAKDSVEPLKP